MGHHPGANHVQVHVNQAASQVLAALDGGFVVAVFPECAPTMLAVVELLARASGDELHAASDLIPTAIAYDQMDVMARHVVVEHAQAEAQACRVQSLDPGAPVPEDLQHELFAMTAMRQMPDVSRQIRQIVSAGPWHGGMSSRIDPGNRVLAYSEVLRRIEMSSLFISLTWSDPDPPETWSDPDPPEGGFGCGLPCPTEC